MTDRSKNTNPGEPDQGGSAPTPQSPAADAPSPRGRRRFLKTGINLLLIFMVFFAVRMWTTRDAIQGPAPLFEGFTVNGPYTSLAAQRGKPVLVHFWATWCPVCKAEQDSIESIAADHQVITIAMKSGPPPDVHKFLRDEGLTFPTLVDPDGALARQYGVTGVPSSFIIDAESNIRFVEVGYSTEAGLRGRLWLAESDEKVGQEEGQVPPRAN